MRNAGAASVKWMEPRRSTLRRRRKTVWRPAGSVFRSASPSCTERQSLASSSRSNFPGELFALPAMERRPPSRRNLPLSSPAMPRYTTQFRLPRHKAPKLARSSVPAWSRHCEYRRRSPGPAAPRGYSPLRRYWTVCRPPNGRARSAATLVASSRAESQGT